jgi:hypothetical protein
MAVLRWFMGIFRRPPTRFAPQPDIPPAPVKNDIDPQDDPALQEMEESLRELDWRSYRLQRERGVFRRQTPE